MLHTGRPWSRCRLFPYPNAMALPSQQPVICGRVAGIDLGTFRRSLFGVWLTTWRRADRRVALPSDLRSAALAAWLGQTLQRYELE